MLLPIALESHYDTDSDVLYICIQPKGTKAIATVQLSDRMLADVDENNNLVGIEMLFFKRGFDAPKKKEKQKAIEKFIAEG